MTISINGENIDYSLEEEVTIGDIYRSISLWLQDSGMLVASLQIDDQAVELVEMEWKDTAIETVDSIAIHAVTLREGRIRQLETAKNFFLLLARSLSVNDNVSMKDLAESSDDLRCLLPPLLDEPASSPLISEVDALFFECGFPEYIGNQKKDSKVLTSKANAFADILESRLIETVQPAIEAEKCAKELAQLAEKLDDVAVELQTGKDKKAMTTIIYLTELLQTLMRVFRWIDGEPKELDGIHVILSELEEALKANDTVLIGDLLEYEIKPRLMELPETLSFLKEAIQ